MDLSLLSLNPLSSPGRGWKLFPLHLATEFTRERFLQSLSFSRFLSLPLSLSLPLTESSSRDKLSERLRGIVFTEVVPEIRNSSFFCQVVRGTSVGKTVYHQVYGNEG